MGKRKSIRAVEAGIYGSSSRSRSPRGNVLILDRRIDDQRVSDILVVVEGAGAHHHGTAAFERLVSGRIAIRGNTCVDRIDQRGFKHHIIIIILVIHHVLATKERDFRFVWNITLVFRNVRIAPKSMLLQAMRTAVW